MSVRGEQSGYTRLRVCAAPLHVVGEGESAWGDREEVELVLKAPDRTCCHSERSVGSWIHACGEWREEGRMPAGLRVLETQVNVYFYSTK